MRSGLLRLILLVAVTGLGCGDGLMGPTWETRSIPYNISTQVAANNIFRMKIDPRDFKSGHNFVLSGTFWITSGGSRDIYAYVVGEISSTIIFSTPSKVKKEHFFSVVLPGDEAYYFILDNSFSKITPKTVRAELELRYEVMKKK